MNPVKMHSNKYYINDANYISDAHTIRTVLRKRVSRNRTLLYNAVPHTRMRFCEDTL
jgi:hypothetical protein